MSTTYYLNDRTRKIHRSVTCGGATTAISLDYAIDALDNPSVIKCRQCFPMLEGLALARARGALASRARELDNDLDRLDNSAAPGALEATGRELSLVRAEIRELEARHPEINRKSVEQIVDLIELAFSTPADLVDDVLANGYARDSLVLVIGEQRFDVRVSEVAR